MHTADWFLEPEFKASKIDDLPVQQKNLYNHQRNSKILMRDI